jgi:hypothetical protein
MKSAAASLMVPGGPISFAALLSVASNAGRTGYGWLAKKATVNTSTIVLAASVRAKSARNCSSSIFGSIRYLATSDGSGAGEAVEPEKDRLARVCLCGSALAAEFTVRLTRYGVCSRCLELHAGGDLPGVEVPVMGVSSPHWPLSQCGEGPLLGTRSTHFVRAALARQSRQHALRHRRFPSRITRQRRGSGHRSLLSSALPVEGGCSSAVITDHHGSRRECATDRRSTIVPVRRRG